MPLPKFARQYLNFLLVEKNLAQRSIFDYSVTLITFFRWVKMMKMGSKSKIPFPEIDVTDISVEDIAHLDRNDIFDFLSFCMTELNNKTSTRAVKLSALKSFYQYMTRYGSVGADVSIEDPTKDVSSPKGEKPLPKFLTIAEAKQLLAAVDGASKERDYCIILWFLTCGMRLSELVNIDLKDVKADSVRIHGKGRKERIIHLNEPCRKALESYMDARALYKRGKDDPALFISPRTGKRLTPRRVEQMLQDNYKRAGLPGSEYGVHTLRHSAASNLLREGLGSITDVQALLGHESIATTQLYLHLSNENVNKALDSIGEIL